MLRWHGPMALGVGAVIMLGFVMLVVVAVVKVFAKERLCKEGVLTSARIVKIRVVSTGQTPAPPDTKVEALLEVQSNASAPYLAQLVFYISPLHLARFQVGSPVMVRVDHRRPSVMVIEEEEGVVHN